MGETQPEERHGPKCGHRVLLVRDMGDQHQGGIGYECLDRVEMGAVGALPKSIDPSDGSRKIIEEVLDITRVRVKALER